ncbi:MAG: DUF1292 domain-containing protein [Erysipelotrichaceae bacterium]|jgi:uncharacterized protein YrzB (UPF0473 family)|nr:DUF1292 domain-containing protein [Erysipelotrichaceae bacterium]
MAEIKENQIVITDDNGEELVMEILFTYENEERNKKYVFFYDPNDEENVLAMSYDEETGELFEIEDDEEYEEVEEVFNAYNEDPEIQNLKEN